MRHWTKVVQNVRCQIVGQMNNKAANMSQTDILKVILAGQIEPDLVAT